MARRQSDGRRETSTRRTPKTRARLFISADKCASTFSAATGLQKMRTSTPASRKDDGKPVPVWTTSG
jgi:hypothetical protein